MRALLGIALTLAAAGVAAADAGDHRQQQNVVGSMTATIDGIARTFKLYRGVKGGSGWSAGPRGPVINLMGVRGRGMDRERVKVRFPVDRSTGEMLCDAEDAVFEYYTELMMYQVQMDDCSAIELDKLELPGEDGLVEVTGTFSGVAGGVGGSDERHRIEKGRFEARLPEFSF